jgi:glycosyltransferase involved in cell wall biosynthesis
VFEAGRAIAKKLDRIHAADPIDVFEIEESFGWAADVALHSQVPVVCKLHGPAFLTMVDEELRTEHGREKVRREGEALARLPVIVSPSRFTLEKTLARYGLKPSIAEKVVNPLASCDGIPLWDLEACDRKAVLYVGRFDRIKGADLLILAFQRLLARTPDLRLIFVGPDFGLIEPGGVRVHFHDYVASLNDPALAAAISYRGSVGQGEVSGLRTGALLTVISSRCENQPYSALEAMVQACPLVCTDAAGHGELIQHEVTGLKSRPEDPEDLAAQMQRLIDDPFLGRKLGLAAREYVLAHHGPATVVRSALDVYRRTIALRAPSIKQSNRPG